jgi:peptidoglycan/LPS O-acetylase OafA/YrhL
VAHRVNIPDKPSRNGRVVRTLRDVRVADAPPTGREAGPARAARLPGLDALRGLALLLVMLNHAHPGVFGAGGMLGVTLFFTLSGFLITGLLLRDLERTGGVHYGGFFLARLLRLLPPLLLVLAGYAVVEGVVDHGEGRALVGDTLLTGLTYTMNLPFVPHGSGSMYHLWTLATEEQFYLVWPLVLALAWRRRAVGRVIVTGIAVALLACAATLVYQGAETARVYALPTSWASALLIGCGLRVAQDRVTALLPTAPRVRLLLGGVLVALLLAGAVLPAQGDHPWTYLITLPVVAAGSGVLVLLAWTARPALGTHPVIRLCARLGTISYAAYLWNLPIQTWIGDPRTLLGGVIGAALTIAAATASWWLVERPAARLRRRLTARAAAPSPAA